MISKRSDLHQLPDSELYLSPTYATRYFVERVPKYKLSESISQRPLIGREEPFMKIMLVVVPYDSGQRCVRMGRGPDHFLGQGLEAILKESGHTVSLFRIESQEKMTSEIGAAFELNRLLAQCIQGRIDDDLPVVLAGNCNSSLGTIAGVDPDNLGVVWFDAHGDFNTPETTTSGFLDGMGLATVAGCCWKSLVKTIPGFKPVPAKNIILVGACDLDYEEDVQIKDAGIPLVRMTSGEGDFKAQFGRALAELRRRAGRLYLHIDLDAMDFNVGRANHFASGNLSPELVHECIGMIKQAFKIDACGITAFDPAYDQDNTVVNAGMKIIETIVE